MSSQSAVWTLGVEEEYQIIDPGSHALCSDSDAILSSVRTLSDIPVFAELQQCQIEMTTSVCQNLAEVRAELYHARQVVNEAATSLGRRIVATATHPFSPWYEQKMTPSVRYQNMMQMYKHLLREQVFCGCHVHIGYSDSKRAIHVMNRTRIWLASLLALAGNSPFWLGDDTNYSSYRTELWWRWPAAGPPPYFTSRGAYNKEIQSLTATGSVSDPTSVYWDIRLSERFPTIEFRVTDVCMTIDEAVMITGLIRALVQTCHEQELCKIPYPIPSSELLRSAHWRAARFGLESELFDITLGHNLPANECIGQLLNFVRPALEQNGDWSEVSQLVDLTLRRGNGASRQRAAYQQRGNIHDVVDFVLQETIAESVVPQLQHS